MAARYPAQREPRAAQRTVLENRVERVGTARRVEPAVRAGHRADEPAVPADQEHEDPGTRGGPCLRWLPARIRRHRKAPTCRRMSVPITRSSSAARSAWRAVAACG